MRFFSHLKTVIRHKNAVFLHCCKAGIPVRGFLHDLSKFSPVEFLNGVKYYQGTRSPNEEEREENGYSLAWMHHKGRNRHHFEYWNDVSPVTKRYEPVKMPLKYFKEMFCDRVAASKIYQGKNYTDAHPFNYFDRGNENVEVLKFFERLQNKVLLRGNHEDLLLKLLQTGKVLPHHYINGTMRVFPEKSMVSSTGSIAYLPKKFSNVRIVPFM